MTTDAAIILTVLLLIAAVGVSLMYATQFVARLTGAMLSSAMILAAFGWLGLANFWLVLGLMMVVGTARVRPLFRRSRPAI